MPEVYSDQCNIHGTYWYLVDQQNRCPFCVKLVGEGQTITFAGLYPITLHVKFHPDMHMVIARVNGKLVGSVTNEELSVGGQARWGTWLEECRDKAIAMKWGRRMRDEQGTDRKGRR